MDFGTQKFMFLVVKNGLLTIKYYRQKVFCPATNSGLSQLRILLKPDVDFPLENLILAETTQFRSSQLTRRGETLWVILNETHTIHINDFDI